ncbi:DeoR/GlpR family transcriptional regulator of sugar metabolism [Sporomusaceae bacterium BoRhaA]|uniref:DeoR/GlpR family DNA-binding transcription regulator n=1 Tax=Pelorhabdus rhamnosifermentans TaxID=2772457 RepID=UPI001C0620A7|nr:DeoR/GlpR family DNA-binding transcription regulator [Pelorhabdus rhamnosifermentans]MBU2702576.1 DeoR/GlpR family transcriptional regulator of sugar metabolism [Pelorhabdus rhamnosifermentans]
MLANIQRRNDIVNLIFKLGSVKVTDLAEKYGVNEATIRRDLKYLSQNHKITLTYGGAFIEKNTTCYSIVEINLANKRMMHFDEKQVIARKAAALIKDGETIALNAGSTVEYILDYLENITQLNVVTLCLHVAAKAARLPYVTVYMPGGKLRNSSGVFYGNGTEKFLKKFSVDKCFFGVAAINLKKGIMHPVLEEIENNRIMLDISEQKYLVADYSKYDCVSLASLTDLEEFTGFIVDDKFPDVYKEFAKLNDIQII